MPRKGHIAKRGVAADPVYQSDLVTKFVNSMMWQGKKSTAQGIFYEALTQLQAKGGDEAPKLFKLAVEKPSPCSK
jgi:small subunit ribosomal protein S7